MAHSSRSRAESSSTPGKHVVQMSHATACAGYEKHIVNGAMLVILPGRHVMSSGTPRRSLHEARAAAALRPNVEGPAAFPAAPPAIDGEVVGIVSSAIEKGSPAVPAPLPMGVDGCPTPPPTGVPCLPLAFAAAACVTMIGVQLYKPATANCQLSTQLLPAPHSWPFSVQLQRPQRRPLS